MTVLYIVDPFIYIFISLRGFKNGVHAMFVSLWTIGFEENEELLQSVFNTGL